MSARYLVGIDLGTTHTVVAYADTAQGAETRIELFPIEQLVAPGEVAARPLLPSVRYHPAAGELAEADIQLPWPLPGLDDPVVHPVLGEFARKLGAKAPGRLVASAKSWLSHGSVDRTAPILPWGAVDVPKVSPLTASASYLAHVRAAWNAGFADYPLEAQEIVLTVPASFDEAARSLTLEAARLAGLPGVRLLEEPQAVCYDWLWVHRGSIRSELSGIRLLLVCDVGGGTTDLTLVRVEPGDGEPVLTRIGVGDHLMLGGDNIDLTLAQLAEQRLASGPKRLSAGELSQLIEQCRVAKERLLAESAPESATVALFGGGSRLIGGVRSAELSREEVRGIVLDGFFPLTGLGDYPDRKRSGVVEFGLPYAADPAISKHLAAFLNHHRQVAREALGHGDGAPMPDAVLLNGGVFRSAAIAQRLLELIGSWRGSAPRRLENQRPDLAVACGAVAFGMARRSHDIQTIGGGSARSYFLLVASDDAGLTKAVCILPRGSEEGREVFLAGRVFALQLGRPVRFHLVSSTEDTPYQPSDVVVVDDDRFQPLPPLAMALEQGDQVNRRDVNVQLAATLTDMGSLRIQLVTITAPEQRWNLEFQLRQGIAASTVRAHENLPPRHAEAADLIRLLFGKKARQIDAKAVKGLRAELEKLLGKRESWNTPLLRELFGALLAGVQHRRRSADHERVWLSLAGYCLRPGFGYPLDDWRVEQLWAIYGQGIQFVNEVQNWTEWWTLWRRVAGGLSEAAQQTVFADIADFIDPEKARRGVTASLLPKRGYEDMVRLAAVLERLPVERKKELGEWLLQRLKKPSEPEQSWWALGRVGTRVPFHGSAHTVVPSEVAAAWLETLFVRDWKRTPFIGFAATLLARLSGDRERDLDQDLRQRTIERLRLIKAPESWVEMITEVKTLDEADEKRIFGEALPPGLRLIA
jgi:molecular chaperone DnaK (HSP70)